MVASSSTHGDRARPAPLCLTHHFSRASRKRTPNVLKEYYKFLRIPEMGNFAGGLPFHKNFPFDAWELLTVAPGSLDGDISDIRSEGIASRMLIDRTSDAERFVHKIDLDTSLQYGGAQGYPPLYAWLKKLANSVYHPNVPFRGGVDVMIDGGSTDGLFKIYELLFNRWDRDVNILQDREGLLVEEFVYAPPLAQIRPWDVNVVPVKMDTEGMLAYGPGSLFDILETWDFSQGKRPHAVYIIPTGQNPTSGVLSFSRRQDIYNICSRFDVVIIEDDPYWNLYYPSANSLSMAHRGSLTSSGFPVESNHNYCTENLKGQSTGYSFLDTLPPSLLSIDVDGRVIRLDSFSKTLAPGCRLGWITAQPSVCEQLFRITDSTTQQPSGFVQVVIAKLLCDTGINASGSPAPWGLDGWVRRLEGLRSSYERRMITMATILEKNRFVLCNGRQVEMFTFNWPLGGMFIWVQMKFCSHPLVSKVAPGRLMSALWIFCTQHPYRVLTVPGGDFAARSTAAGLAEDQFLRFCFAAVAETTLTVKSKLFVDACTDFWSINDVQKIDRYLREEDALALAGSKSEGGAIQDREAIEDW